MHKVLQQCSAAFAVLALAVAGAHADRLSLADAVSLALERSTAVENAERVVRSAFLARGSVLDATAPRFALSAEPLYGVRTQRGPSFAFPPDVESTVVHSSGASLAVTQTLPTSGVVSGTLSAAFSSAVSFPDDGDPTAVYTLSPRVSLSLSQPLFVDGRLLESERPALGLLQADRGVLAAGIGRDAAAEQTVSAVVRLYVQLGSVRRAAYVQRIQQELLRIQLAEAVVRQEQQQGSRQAVLAVQVQINRSRDLELQSLPAARELELQLERLTGARIDSGTILEPTPDASVVEALLGSLPAAMSAPVASLRQALNHVERARTEEEIVRKQERATARVQLSLSPRYADTRESPGTLLGAITDYGGDGAGVDVSFSLSVQVALRDGGARARAAEQASIARARAESELASLKEDHAYEWNRLLGRIATNRERIDLVTFDLEFEREQLAADVALLESGLATQADVARRRAVIAVREAERENLHGELFLQAIEAARLFGLDPASVVASFAGR